MINRYHILDTITKFKAYYSTITSDKDLTYLKGGDVISSEAIFNFNLYLELYIYLLECSLDWFEVETDTILTELAGDEIPGIDTPEGYIITGEESAVPTASPGGSYVITQTYGEYRDDAPFTLKQLSEMIDTGDELIKSMIELPINY